MDAKVILELEAVPEITIPEARVEAFEYVPGCRELELLTAQGTVFGKALEALTTGQGLIYVFVTLQ